MTEPGSPVSRTRDAGPLHRETLTALLGVALRASLRLGDLALVAPRSRRLVGYELRALGQTLVGSPYQGPRFDDVLAASRSGASAEDLTYGEVPWLTLHGLLRWAGLAPGELFVDVGCGAGRALALAAAGFGARALGVERVGQRAELARRLLPPGQWPGVRVEHADALEVDLAGGDVVLLNWTCFGDAARARLSDALRGLRPGARAIALTYPVQDPGWELPQSRSVWLSWGRGSAHLQRRR